MASIWDMLFPGGGQAPQFADPNGNPNARLPVPFPGPQQAPYFGAQMNAQQPAPQAPSPTPNDSYDVRLNLLQQAQQQYPVLRGQNYGYVEKLTPDTSAGYLEHWSPGDAGNTSGIGTGPYDVPRPAQLPLDRPGLEIRNPSTRVIDVLGDIVSHNLVNTDPKVKQAYSDLQSSLTPQQQNLLQDQYKYAQKNEQETGTFDEWKQRSGMPGLFRGYAFDQWPKDFTDKVYTPQQKQKLDDMMQYLRGEQQGSSLPIPPQKAPVF